MTHLDHEFDKRLLAAISRNEVSLVKELLEQGADVNVAYKHTTPLHIAARSGHTVMVQLLLEYGARVNSVNDRGIHALMYAAMYRYEQVVKIFLEHGAHVNQADVHGYTVLMHAIIGKGDGVRQDSEPIAGLLLAHGAHVAPKNVQGRDAIDYALERRAWPTVEVLLRHGARVTAAQMNALDDQSQRFLNLLILRSAPPW